MTRAARRPLSIEATRLLVRRERRMVGTFRAESPDEPIAPDAELPALPSARLYFDKENVR